MDFSEFWESLQATLPSGEIIQNWTADGERKGKKVGEEFTIEEVTNELVWVHAPSAKTPLLDVRRSDFETIYERWPAYVNGDISRTEAQKGTQRSKYVFSIIHHLESKVDEVAAVAAIRIDPVLTQTEKDQLVRARLGQGRFRAGVIEHWGKCCLTGCDAVALLRASHIKPWSKSDNVERLDKFNGLLLTPNADALFDQGYITFSDDGEMLISESLSEEAAEVLLAGCRRAIELHDENRPYLEYHRSVRFKGDAGQQ